LSYLGLSPSYFLPIIFGKIYFFFKAFFFDFFKRKSPKRFEKTYDFFF